MERTSEHYGNVAMVLHWTVAALIVAAVVIAWVLPGRHAPNRDVVLALHKSVGALVLAFAAARLLWRRLRPVAPADSLAPWEAWFSAANHALLYGIMIAIPLSGYLFSSAAGQSLDFFNLIELPPLIGPDKALARAAEVVHVTGQWAVYGFVGLHVAGALYHYLIKRDRVLQRMLPARAAGERIRTGMGRRHHGGNRTA